MTPDEKWIRDRQTGSLTVPVPKDARTGRFTTEPKGEGVIVVKEPKVSPVVQLQRALETERSMLDRLNVRYGKVYRNGGYVGREFARAEQVPVGVGFERSRIADFLAVRMFSSHGYEHLPYREQRELAEAGVFARADRTPTLIGHEVKVSRSDWLHELRQPEKAEAWKRYCHEWFLVVSDLSIVHNGELPDDWGLMVTHGRSLRMVTRALRLSPVPMGMSQIAALSRAVMQTETRALALAGAVLEGAGT